MIQKLQFVAILFPTIVLGVSYAITGQVGLALACLFMGLAWATVDWFGIGNIRKKNDISKKSRNGGDPFTDTLAMLFFMAMAGWGIWQSLPTWLMLGVVLLTLAAWDLGRFSARIRIVIDETTAEKLERLHLSRLAMALGTGLFLGTVTLLVHVPLDFGWALLIGSFAIIALNRFSRSISHQ